MTATLAPHSNFSQYGYSELVIYADDVCVYRSPQITRKTKSFDIDVNIKGAEFIKICIEKDKTECSVLLINAFLEK